MLSITIIIESIGIITNILPQEGVDLQNQADVDGTSVILSTIRTI